MEESFVYIRIHYTPVGRTLSYVLQYISVVSPDYTHSLLATFVSETQNYACCHCHTPLYCRAQCYVFYIGYPRCWSVSRALGSWWLRAGILPDRSAERVGSAYCGSKTVARRAMQLQPARSVILRDPVLVFLVCVQIFIYLLNTNFCLINLH